MTMSGAALGCVVSSDWQCVASRRRRTVPKPPTSRCNKQLTSIRANVGGLGGKRCAGEAARNR
jgi:hypothetical protein